MVSRELPIGQQLIAVSAAEDRTFAGDELCLDELRLQFERCAILVRPLPDTDEIEMTVDRAKTVGPATAPYWCSDLLGTTLQTVWTACNAQGYRDQVSFAFAHLCPTLAVVSEGSVLKVFRYRQLLRSQRNGLPGKNRRRNNHGR